ncbi:hypothetical protein I3760_11G079900 [Carya illinoinensis]|nr:hypothetical protein I3760_11G079900 [Carya illinoinensis]
MAPAKTVAASTAKAKKPTTTRSNLGIQKVVPISPQLGKFLGGHLNPANKKEIFCDEKLKSIFEGKDVVGFQEIVKLLSVHFVKYG